MESAQTTTTRIAMTPSQRFHFDAFGYVLLPSILTSDEVRSMRDAILRIKCEDSKGLRAKHIYAKRENDHFFHCGNLVEYDDALLHYATHPSLIPLVEEIVGGSVRLEETEAIVNRKNPEIKKNGQKIIPRGFHTGTRHGWGTYFENNRFHCLFVKTLAYLTDVGKGDGGTALIPGSHRMTWPESEMVDAAMDDQTLIKQIEAPAGSVLLFSESLVHSTTEITSDKERVILVAGYTPPMMREWPGNQVSNEFVQRLPEELQPIVSGSESWHWRRNY